MVREWHLKFGVPVAEQPTIPNQSRRQLRIELIWEEYNEFKSASGFLGLGTKETDLTEAADALADILYVVYGAALEWGIPIEEVFAEVHRSNMSKVWPDGTVHYREDGKVLKPSTYSPADAAGVLRRNA